MAAPKGSRSGGAACCWLSTPGGIGSPPAPQRRRESIRTSSAPSTTAGGYAQPRPARMGVARHGGPVGPTRRTRPSSHCAAAPTRSPSSSQRDATVRPARRPAPAAHRLSGQVRRCGHRRAADHDPAPRLFIAKKDGPRPAVDPKLVGQNAGWLSGRYPSTCASSAEPISGRSTRCCSRPVRARRRAARGRASPNSASCSLTPTALSAPPTIAPAAASSSTRPNSTSTSCR